MAVITMGALRSRADAEAYMREDPLVVNGMVRRWYGREWANMFTRHCETHGIFGAQLVTNPLAWCIIEWRAGT